MIEIIFSHCDYINFYFIAALKHHDEGNSQREGFICAYDSKGGVPYGGGGMAEGG